MSKITQSANGQDCQIRIPGVCNGDNRTVVWCHANGLLSGRGFGLKSPDPLGAYGCSSCHDAYDRRSNPAGLDYREIRMCFYEGHIRSLILLIENELIKVK